MQVKGVVQPVSIAAGTSRSKADSGPARLDLEPYGTELPESGVVGDARFHPEKRPMENAVRQLFERYESFFKRSLDGNSDMDEVASLYASDFIAATPAGVMTGKNDDQLKQVMTQGYAHYRAIGTKGIWIRHIRLSPIDECHCVAHVSWTATYARKDQKDTTIDFDVHYLVQNLDGEAKVFGWVSGDEQALLKQHGIT
jgi:hypothetical protein